MPGRHEAFMPVIAAHVPIRHDRLRIRVRGAVQGVGFRPFMHGLAERYGLSGYVLNDADGVLAEIEGEALHPFLAALRLGASAARPHRRDRCDARCAGRAAGLYDPP